MENVCVYVLYMNHFAVINTINQLYFNTKIMLQILKKIIILCKN